jgi:selenocysteine-specific elongation factor
MIIGTAGHIDHGKTTLVRALTGVDTDRLPEEKARGISIELGYAFLDAPDGTRLGFIDVPGHERLVHTMLSGATGIDLALLLVAADDGVMPQTREHLAVLSLLGIARAIVVLTKADRVDAARLAAVREDVHALLQGTPLEAAPVMAVSAVSGEGVDALRTALLQAAAQVPPRAAREHAFRLAVDRAFTLHGTGTVVTGTIHAGRVRVGDELRLVPGDRPARVRSLHAQNRAVEQAVAGERCAIALVGLERDQIQRGQWVVAPACARTTDRLDLSLSLWHEESAWLRSGTVVHVHLGAATTMGTVAVLRPEALPPGGEGLVQLVLRQPAGAWHGDRVVLRDAAASRTIAGGTVLDPDAPVRYRRTPQRLAQLAALQAPTPAQRVSAWLAAGGQGLDLRRFAAAQGLLSMPPLPEGVLRHTDARGDWALDGAQAAQARDEVLQALADYHRQQPDELGPDAGRLRRLALPRWPEPLWAALLAGMQAEGALSLRGAFVHLPDHGVRLSATEERIAQKVAPLLAAAGFEGAWVRDLARDTQESEALMRVTLARLSQRGELHQIVKDLYHPLPTVATLITLVRQVADEADGEVTAARFRDVTGLGRKRAIQILEHFDRIGLLRRVGDVHRLRRDSALLAAPATEGACAVA